MRDIKPHITKWVQGMGFIITLLASLNANGQSSLIISPSAPNDTLLLCTTGTTQASFEVIGGSGSYTWNFGGGTPSIASGGRTSFH